MQILHSLSCLLCILNLTPGTFSDVAVDVDNKYPVRHIDLALVHVVQHFLCPGRPDFVVAAVSEQPDADDDIPLEGQPLLRLKELFLEPCAPAEGYDRIFSDHTMNSFSTRVVLMSSTSNNNCRQTKSAMPAVVPYYVSTSC